MVNRCKLSTLIGLSGWKSHQSHICTPHTHKMFVIGKWHTYIQSPPRSLSPSPLLSAMPFASNRKKRNCFGLCNISKFPSLNDFAAGFGWAPRLHLHAFRNKQAKQASEQAEVCTKTTFKLIIVSQTYTHTQRVYCCFVCRFFALRGCTGCACMCVYVCVCAQCSLSSFSSSFSTISMYTQRWKIMCIF